MPDVIFAGRVRHRAFLGEYLFLGLLSLVVIGIPFLIARWLRTVTTRWSIDTQRIEHRRGVFSTRTDSLELWRVQDISHEQSIFERMFGDGRIVLHSSDATDPRMVIAGLPDHRAVYERLREAIDAARRRQRVLAVEGESG